jgi:hypothetical protein
VTTTALRSVFSVTLLTLLLASELGCAPPSEDSAGLRLEWTLEPAEPRVGPTTLQLALADDAGRPLAGADLEVEATMSHAGMETVFGTEVREVAPGRYEVPLEFTMAGDWILIVKTELPDGREDERHLDVRGVRPR